MTFSTPWVKKLANDLGTSQKQFADADELRKILNEYGEAVKRRDSLERESKDKAGLISNLTQQLSDLSTERGDLEEARRRLQDYSSLSDIEHQLSEASERMDALREDEAKLNQIKAKQEKIRSDLAKIQDGPSIKEEPKTHPRAKNIWTYLTATAALGAGAVLSFFLEQALAAIALGSLAVVSLILLARQIASLSQNYEISQEQQQQMASAQLLSLQKTELANMEREETDLTSTMSKDSSDILHSLVGIPGYGNRFKPQDTPRQALDALSQAFNQDKQSQRVYSDRVKFLTARLDKEPDLHRRLEDAQKDSGSVLEELSSLKLPDLPKDLVFSESVLRESNQYRDSLSDRVSRLKTQIEESINRQGELREELKDAENIDEKVEEQQRKVGLLEKDLAVLKYSVKGLEQTSESLRNRVKPQVERYMGLILPVITSGHYKAVQLDDDYTVKIFDPEAGEFKPKEVFSGGTEDQVLLAMRLAFALALIPQAKGKSPEFLFLDEPLGSSDRLRRDGILALLKGELAQNFKQIFLISHVGDLEAEADTIIHMDNGNIAEVVNRSGTQTEPPGIPA